MMQSLAGEVNTALSPRHHGYAMCLKLSSCRIQLEICRYRATGTPLSRPLQPNALWCADFKGEFQISDRRYCFPLTITDFASRYLIRCEALASTKAPQVFTVFERAFQEFGLPLAIRTDNGLPFGCGNAL